MEDEDTEIIDLFAFLNMDILWSELQKGFKGCDERFAKLAMRLLRLWGRTLRSVWSNLFALRIIIFRELLELLILSQGKGSFCDVLKGLIFLNFQRWTAWFWCLKLSLERLVLDTDWVYFMGLCMDKHLVDWFRCVWFLCMIRSQALTLSLM